MQRSAYLHYLSRAVEAMHGCPCSHVGNAKVHEMFEGQTVWEGEVEIFDLEGHPEATQAFAWGWKDDEGEIRYIAVLNIPPILSPREAVQAAIASRRQR